MRSAERTPELISPSTTAPPQNHNSEPATCLRWLEKAEHSGAKSLATTHRLCSKGPPGEARDQEAHSIRERPRRARTVRQMVLAMIKRRHHGPTRTSALKHWVPVDKEEAGCQGHGHDASKQGSPEDPPHRARTRTRTHAHTHTPFST